VQKITHFYGFCKELVGCVTFKIVNIIDKRRSLSI